MHQMTEEVVSQRDLNETRTRTTTSDERQGTSQRDQNGANTEVRTKSLRRKPNLPNRTTLPAPLIPTVTEEGSWRPCAGVGEEVAATQTRAPWAKAVRGSNEDLWSAT